MTKNNDHCLVCAAITKCHRQGGLKKKRNLFLAVLKAGSLRMRCQHGQAMVRALFWLQTVDSLFLHRAERARELALWGLFYKGTYPIPEARSPGVGHGNPLQYSCLENPMDRGA